MMIDHEPVHSGTASKAAFARRPLAVEGVEIHYADHWFGTSLNPFSLAALDRRLSGQEAIGIVNAANEQLLGGGGIDAAIFHEEGLGNRAINIGKALKPLGKSEIASGEAIAADSGNLLAQNVGTIIHAVGPRKGDKGFDDVLRATVRSVLDRASERKLEVIIMANISSAIFSGDPVETANVIQAEVERLLAAPPMDWAGWLPKKIIFNNFPKGSKPGVKMAPKRKAEHERADEAKYPKPTKDESTSKEDEFVMGAEEKAELEHNMQ
jgi:O-acetyl-ADP-ribose deacetylase (regulator of RNase III)